ncbi:unnamed protein product [Clavelina lepadiformis]|uniref:CUB domain-containing protein n=1 Tax=Clavelina lepadiformis TaxID=159417 RepID=A0ABP0F2Q7_CLALP
MQVYVLLAIMTLAAAQKNSQSSCLHEMLATSELQVINSKNFPQQYSDNTDCQWTLVATGRNQVRLTVWTAVTEECCDIITIHEGYDKDAPIIGTLRGNITNPATYTSSFGAFTVSFITDGSVTASGFIAYYSLAFTNETTVLNANIFEQTLTSPNYPSQYPNNFSQSWIIEAPPNHIIVFRVQDFSTEACCDSLTIFDAVDNYFRVLATIRGRNRTFEEYRSSSGALLIRLSTNEAVSNRGFRAVYQSIPEDLENIEEIPPPPLCKEDFIVPSQGHGEFSSPVIANQKYGNNMKCLWTITAPHPDQRIRLWFSYVQTEACCDWIIVTDGLTKDDRTLVHLGNKYYLRLHMTSTGPTIKVEFLTDTSGTAAGFRAVYKLHTGL